MTTTQKVTAKLATDWRPDGNHPNGGVRVVRDDSLPVGHELPQGTIRSKKVSKKSGEVHYTVQPRSAEREAVYKKQQEVNKLHDALKDVGAPDSALLAALDRLHELAPEDASKFSSLRADILRRRDRQRYQSSVQAKHDAFAPALIAAAKERFPDWPDEKARREAAYFLSPENGEFDSLDDAMADWKDELDEHAKEANS